MEIVRQINIEYSITAAEEEKERRLREYDVAKVQEQLVRERRKSDATKAIEEERQRRISNMQQGEKQEATERNQKQQAAVKAMERERVRRLSSSEHQERLRSTGADTAPGGYADDLDADPASVIEASFSEIPVVQASSSKLLVDENSEWRCFISSENPDEEKEKLKCEFLFLVFVS